MAKTKIEKYLEKIYYDPNHPASYGREDTIYNAVKSDDQNISRSAIRKWLKSQDVYVKYKPVRRNFKRRRVVVAKKFDQFDADTINISYL